ncbi:glycosyltransferase family 4 protein [Aeromonas sp. 164P]
MTLHIMHVNLAKGFRGGERQTELLIKALADLNIKQTLVCRADSPLRQHLAGVAVDVVTANHQAMGHLAAPAVDIVHAHEAKAVHWAWLHHLLRRTPYILTRRVPQSVRQSTFNRLCYRGASCAVAISSPIKRHLEDRHWCAVTQIPSVLAHLPANAQEIEKLTASYGNEKFIIAHAGALVDKHKGQSVLIEAARLLQHRIPNALFLMLGDGPDKEWLQQQSADLINMKWLGFKNNLGDYLSIIDLFVFPSRNEGLGSTLLDVMDYQVPIIASDVDGIPDVVAHQQTGWLVPVGDSQQLADAIWRLYQDPELRQRLVNNARAQLSHYTPAKMAERYSALYMKVLNR